MQKCPKTIGSDDTSVVSACALYFEKKFEKIHAWRIPHLYSVNKREYVLKKQRNYQNHFQYIPKRLLIN